jgi:hypothetical protein
MVDRSTVVGAGVGGREALQKLAGMVRVHNDSGLVYLLLEAAGDCIRADAENEVQIEVKAALEGLTFIPVRRVARSLMREMVDFYTPGIDSTENSRERFRGAVRQLDRLLSALVGLARWNDLKDGVYCVQRGPLYHEVGLIVKAAQHELDLIEQTIRLHPDMKHAKGLLMRFKLGSKSETAAA